MYPIIAVWLAVSPSPFGSPAKHLGELKAGPVVVADVPLTHIGPGRVTVTVADGSCGCLRAVVDRPELSAGETTTLRVSLNTLALATGPNSWRVSVRTRQQPDGGEVTTDVRLTADVVREIDLSPPAVSLSTTGAAEQTVTLTDRRPRPLTVTAATCDWSPLVVEVENATPGRPTRIRLRLSEAAAVGHHTATVVLTTDDPAYRELRLPVSVSKRAAGAVAVSPETVSLRFADGQAEAAGRVLIRSPAGGSVRIAAAECGHPAVQVRFADTAGPTVTVRVGVTGRGRGRTTVRIRLAEPAGQLVEVPVNWSDE